MNVLELEFYRASVRTSEKRFRYSSALTPIAVGSSVTIEEVSGLWVVESQIVSYPGHYWVKCGEVKAMVKHVVDKLYENGKIVAAALIPFGKGGAK